LVAFGIGRIAHTLFQFQDHCIAGEFSALGLPMLSQNYEFSVGGR
jgi:hypothetical protein